MLKDLLGKIYMLLILIIFEEIFEMNGIEQDSEEGAKRRLPYIEYLRGSFNSKFCRSFYIEIIKVVVYPFLFGDEDSV